MNKSAVEVCNYLDKNVTKVSATLGWEQEYFVIDEALANARPDLILSGRNRFFGHARQKASNSKTIILVLYPKEYTHSCAIMKRRAINWVFL